MKRFINIMLSVIFLCTYTAIAFGEPRVSNQVPEQAVAININNTKDVNCSSYLSYLEKNAKPPIEYVLEKFNDHDLVIVGEIHHVQQNLEFLQQLIPKLYKQAGVRFLGYEFFASSCQKDIDKLVNGEEYDTALVEHIIRESAIRSGLIWPYQEYVDTFKTVWELNKSITEKSDRFRIVFMHFDNNWHDLHYGNEEQKKASMLNFMEGDKLYAEPIINEYKKNQHKGLIWCGTTHAVTRLKGNGRNRPEKRTGGYLYQKYGGKVFQIMLHGFWYYRDRQNAMDYALDGLLDNVLNTHSKPIGFDIAESPLADIKLPKDFIWFIDNPGATFGRYCDGYIWLVSLEKFKGNHVMDIAEIVPNEEIFQKIRRNSHSKLVQETKSRQKYIAVWKEEDQFEQFQQTFMSFLSDKNDQNP
jgi:hypothetical protein